ncbi:MAG: class I SAM-dependent methyltransferase [Myxococcales bacterium]|nr:class I SAM-dependent methyltransferase [Myxococcales bacterium]
MTDSKDRFTDRVDDYVRYRPGYPEEAIAWLVERTGLGPGRDVADVGAGTGILTRQLLGTGARVIAVEPNAAMRDAAAAELGADPSFAGRFATSSGSAEETGLADQSVDVVAAGQAFHWFDPALARAEFARVLRPPGAVVLLWNLRGDTPLIRDYEDLLVRFAPGYGEVRMRERAEEGPIRAFFSPGAVARVRFEHEQRFDEAGLRGRLLSASYAPRPGHPLHAPMLQRLSEIFRAHERGGEATFAYETVVYAGTLGAP